MAEDEEDATLAPWMGLIWNAHLLDELENLYRSYGQLYRPHKQLPVTCGFGMKGLRCLRPLETAKSSEAMFAGPPDFPSRSLAVIFVFSFNLGILLVPHLSPRMGWGIRGEDYCSDPSCVLQIFYPCHSPSTYWELAFGNSESRPSFMPFTATGLLPG